MSMNKASDIIVTLYEGHYHFGVAALTNSLIKANFNGLLRVGYRGELPLWVNQLKNIKDQDYYVNEGIIISFITLNTDMHFGYYKPQFMYDTLLAYPVAQRIFYFDPDIVVNAPWHFFSSWVASGVALCLDNCFYFVHRNHPWRKEWMALANVEPTFECQVDHYVNSGFVGLNRSNIDVLKRWILLTEKYRSAGGSVTSFDKTGYRAVKTDQDLLNAVMTISDDLKFSLIGTEGMGFSFPAYLMSHAVSDVKPWKKNFLADLIKKGARPNVTDKDYMNSANFPIVAYDKLSFKLKSVNMKVASMLGRIIG